MRKKKNEADKVRIRGKRNYVHRKWERKRRRKEKKRKRKEEKRKRGKGEGRKVEVWKCGVS